MTDKQKRDYYVEHINQYLIGPGADVFGVNKNEELLASYPLQTYYSGMLFPERKDIESVGTEDENNSQADNVEQDAPPIDEDTKQVNEGSDENKSKENDKKEVYKAVNSYFPTNCGLTFCVHENTDKVQVKFKAARYKQTKSLSDIIVEIEKNDYDSFINFPDFPFSENLDVKEKDDSSYWLFLSKSIASNSGGSKRKINGYKSILRDKEMKPLTYHIGFKKLDLLTSGIVFKRYTLEKDIDLDLTKADDKPLIIFEEDDKIRALCYIKIISKRDKKYVKLLLKNAADKHPINEFSYSKESLNEKSLFQVSIEVDAPLLPYKDEVIENKYDDEASIINYQHRDLKSYGIGHGTAVTWDRAKTSPDSLKTTFLPQIPIRSVSNKFRDDEQYLKEIANIKNLSIWTDWKQNELCDQLDIFVSAYKTWIDKQQNKVADENKFVHLGNKITDNQISNYERLKRNVELLRTNKTAYDTFLLANTAMYIQLVISIDERFGNKEKELYEMSNIDVDYTSLSFFETYIPEKEPIEYRPFQLAFFLLNIEGIVNEDADDRNDIVDLLWFPTGGGKTEAYLAVTAFTILWRRIKHPNNFHGVSVIMRYTLRLLTAQQFERASRLVVALEFLNKRQDKLFTKALYENRKIGDKTIPISIGMWVGGATTPNKIEDANREINTNDNDTLLSRISKLNELSPDKRPKNADSVANVFQISACAWCGCKTITKPTEQGKFSHAFNTMNRKFTIECKNPKCDFHSSLPINVVDDSLYKSPPTLLFATVDKFAQLSHREEGHHFFNSLDSKKLPPDLIIQDELHLLNGPLGSIVGLFEIMVERLCTKGNRKPKIIASTATTRNTDKQIANLYGGRSVNIFPPLGITYDDNYFSFTDTQNEGKRLHIGFMPTGKTAVDSQVRALLPHLLFTRMLLYKKLGLDDKELDNYWTIVSYYNTLKDVGKTYNKVNDEILTVLKRLHEQHNLDKLQYNFNSQWLMSRTRELTSRIESTKIKSYLNELFSEFETKVGDEGYRNLSSDVVSLVLASNMLSVGIDVSRLNIMLMNGQPKNTAEYIQASSRVARKFDGLVVNLLDANRAREKSYFENYLPFHQAYYKYVEPLTVTPFTPITFNKAFNSLFVCYVRHILGIHKNKQAHDFTEEDGKQFLKFMQENLPAKFYEKLSLEERVKDFIESWQTKIETKQNLNKKLTYKTNQKQSGLIANSQKSISDEEELFALMNSMREIDTESAIDINIYHTVNSNNNESK